MGGPLRGVQAIRAFALLTALARRSGTRYPGRCGHRRVQRFGGAVQEVFADANREVTFAWEACFIPYLCSFLSGCGLLRGYAN